jgi:hypothetical protein
MLAVAAAATVAVVGDRLAVGVDGGGSAFGPVYFYQRRDGNWQPVKSAGNENSAGASADSSGRRIAFQGDEVVVGQPNWNPGSRDNVGPAYAGRAWLKRLTGDTWRPEGELEPRDESGVGANQFGANVAFAGDLVAIGSANHGDDPQPHPGTVCLFHREAAGWQLQAALAPPGTAKKSGFGAGPVALSGGTLAVADAAADAAVPNVHLFTGDPTGKPGTIANAGAVDIYQDGKWLPPIVAPDPEDNVDRSGSPDDFAVSVALDGDTLAVGAPGRHDGTGTVYLWRRQDGQWKPAGEIKGYHPDYRLSW